MCQIYYLSIYKNYVKKNKNILFVSIFLSNNFFKFTFTFVEVDVNLKLNNSFII